MKAIISNGKRTQIFSNQLKLDALKEFTSANFPRMKNPVLKIKDPKGELIQINSNSDLQSLAKCYQGQNFIEILIAREGKGKETQTNGDHKKNANKILKRQTILQKIYGGSVEEYLKFITQNEALPVGKLIKKFGEDNGILKKKEKGTEEGGDRKLERKRKVLEKIFGSDGKDKQQQFLKQNIDLKLGQLIKKYSEVTGLKETNTQEKNLRRKERIIQKLSVVLEKPKQDVLPLVQKHPQCNFRQLLKILETQEGLQIDSEKLKKHHHGRKDHKEHGESKEHKEYKKEHKEHGHGNGHGHKEHHEHKQYRKFHHKHRAESKERKMEEKKFFEKIQIQDETRKQNILATMQGIFSTEQPAKLMKFIQQNYVLGEAGIIQKWLNN